MPRRPQLRTIAGLILALLAGCRTPPPPAPEAAPFFVTVTHFAGSPFSGPDHVEQLGDTSEFRQVEVTLYTLPVLPEDLLDSAASRARLILATGETIELQPTLTLARNARFGDGAAADLPLTGALEAESIQALVAPGLTARIILTERSPGTGRAPEGLLRFYVHQAWRSRETVMAFTVIAPAQGEEQALPRIETATFLLSPETGNRGLLILPSAFPTGGRAIAARIRISETRDPDGDTTQSFQKRVLESLAQATEAFGRVQALATPISEHALVARAVRKVIDTADEPDGGRRTFISLAQWAGAPFAEDLALLAPDPVFLEFRQEVLLELSKQVGAPVPTETGWILESQACQAALAGHARGEVDPEFVTAVIRRAGQVGMHPGLFADLAEESTSLDDFQQRLLAENLTFLLDAEPAARVWAYDWLVEQGAAPAGYDPLAGEEERRSALRAALESSGRKP